MNAPHWHVWAISEAKPDLISPQFSERPEAEEAADLLYWALEQDDNVIGWLRTALGNKHLLDGRLLYIRPCMEVHDEPLVR